MSEKEVNSLLERAEEMLKENNSRKIGAEEIITILKEYKKLQQQLELKDKVIDNLYSDIEYEYSGTSYLKSLEEYYEEVKNE